MIESIVVVLWPKGCVVEVDGKRLLFGIAERLGEEGSGPCFDYILHSTKEMLCLPALKCAASQ